MSALLRLTRLATKFRPSSLVACRGRTLCTETPPEDTTVGEKKLTEILHEKFPDAEHVLVQDISGGCGAMYDVQLISSQFKGKRTILQHRMVNEALKEEIQDMHGLRIRTSPPTE